MFGFVWVLKESSFPGFWKQIGVGSREKLLETVKEIAKGRINLTIEWVDGK